MSFGVKILNTEGYSQISDYRSLYAVEERMVGTAFLLTGLPYTFTAHRNLDPLHNLAPRAGKNSDGLFITSVGAYHEATKTWVSPASMAIRAKLITDLGVSQETHGIRSYGPSGELLMDSGYSLVKFDAKIAVPFRGSISAPAPTIFTFPPTIGTRYWVGEVLTPNGLSVPMGGFIDNNTLRMYGTFNTINYVTVLTVL